MQKKENKTKRKCLKLKKQQHLMFMFRLVQYLLPVTILLPPSAVLNGKKFQYCILSKSSQLAVPHKHSERWTCILSH